MIDIEKEALEITLWSIPDDMTDQHIHRATEKIKSLCQRIRDEERANKEKLLEALKKIRDLKCFCDHDMPGIFIHGKSHVHCICHSMGAGVIIDRLNPKETMPTKEGK